jgi:biotin operon repressor
MLDSSRMESLVAFYGTLADATRLKLIGLLALKPMCGADLARELGVSAPTVSHHIGKLKALDLVKSVREDTAVYYSLQTERLHSLSKDIFGGEGTFFAEGRLKDIPVQLKKRRYVYEEMLKAFDPARTYSEQEINEIIKRYHPDYCTIRREFIIYGYMSRDNGVYQVNPPEKWLGMQ